MFKLQLLANTWGATIIVEILNHKGALIEGVHCTAHPVIPRPQITYEPIRGRGRRGNEGNQSLLDRNVHQVFLMGSRRGRHHLQRIGTESTRIIACLHIYIASQCKVVNAI